MEIAVGDGVFTHTKAYFFVEHSTKEVIGVDLSLHVDIGFAGRYLFNCYKTHFGLVLFIDDFKVGEVYSCFTGCGSNIIGITHKNGVGYTGYSCLLEGRDKTCILSHCDTDCFGTLLCSDLFSIFEKS